MYKVSRKTVAEWQAAGVLHVEDGNHGENRPRKHEFTNEGMAFIRAADMADGTVLFEQAEKIDEVAQARVRKGIGRPGDILISHKGTIGRVARAPLRSPSFVCSPQTTFWRVLNKDALDQDYLFALMRSCNFQTNFSVRAGETDMAGYVSLTSQRELELELPPIEVQRTIGRLISSIDDKIELNRKTAVTLEEMARALYRSWFVDFDPVWAKAQGRTPAHMDEATTALFPDSFGDNGLPMRWKMVSLSSIATFLNGAALQKYPADANEESFPVIKIAELRNGISARTGRASLQIPDKYRINDGDVLFSWSGSLLQKVWTEGNGALNQHLFKVSSSFVPKWFHYFAVDQHMEEFRRIADSKATTMGHIQRHHLDDALISLPPDKTLCAADNIIRPLFEKWVTCDLENQTLAAFRDTLLPKLMSGALRVSEAQQLVEAVA